MSWKMFHGHAINRIQELCFQILGGETIPPIKCKNFINTYYSFKFFNGLRYTFCGALYVRECRNHFLQCYKWGSHFGILGLIKRFVRQEQRNFFDQHTCKNLDYDYIYNWFLKQSHSFPIGYVNILKAPNNNIFLNWIAITGAPCKFHEDWRLGVVSL